MMYHVTLCNGHKTVLSQTADLPTCMYLLSLLMHNDWTFAELTSEQTGEVLAAWQNNSEYGMTSAL